MFDLFLSTNPTAVPAGSAFESPSMKSASIAPGHTKTFHVKLVNPPTNLNALQIQYLVAEVSGSGQGAVGIGVSGARVFAADGFHGFCDQAGETAGVDPISHDQPCQQRVCSGERGRFLTFSSAPARTAAIPKARVSACLSRSAPAAEVGRQESRFISRPSGFRNPKTPYFVFATVPDGTVVPLFDRRGRTDVTPDFKTPVPKQDATALIGTRISCGLRGIHAPGRIRLQRDQLVQPAGECRRIFDPGTLAINA